MRRLGHLLVAVLAAVVLLVVATPPAGATVHTVAHECDGDLAGDQILRCVEFHWDDVNQRVRAYGGVIDNPGGGDYLVMIKFTQTCSSDSPQYGGGCTLDDFPLVWEEQGDVGADAALWDCRPGTAVWHFNAETEVAWKNKTTGGISSDFVDTSYSC